METMRTYHKCTYSCVFGMTSSLTSHGALNVISGHFFLNSFPVPWFDTKIFHVMSMTKGNMQAGQYQANLPFVFINVPYRKTTQLKTVLWRYFSSQFSKKIHHKWRIEWRKYYVCVQSTFGCITHVRSHSNFWIHNLIIMLLDCLGGCIS